MTQDFPEAPSTSVRTEPWLRDYTLDDVQLEIRCPLDNGRHTFSATRPRQTLGQLDKLPAELLVDILLYLDLPSLTQLRRVNLRAMDTVNSVPQYASLIRHCPNIVRAAVAVQATGFDCRTLHATLSTDKCATCDHFGYHLYLINCQRVCHYCYTERIEYFPLSEVQASKGFTAKALGRKRKRTISSKQLLYKAKCPSILSLPGGYCPMYSGGKAYFSPRRTRLFDRLSVDPDLLLRRPKFDRMACEPRRFMAIITAPYLSIAGADWGYFCLGCRNDTDPETGQKTFRFKYTKQGIGEHMARNGPVVDVGRPEYRDMFAHDRSK